ncbi:putative DNA binding domain-containing protein [Patescibacteria group bacterium]|nr:putative DNA binding domain-containing protein [Patescibacteria group bacterium]
MYIIDLEHGNPSSTNPSDLTTGQALEHFNIEIRKQETKKLIEKGESESLELKPSLSQIKEIIQTIAGFANKNGGKIIIGVSSKSKILGLQIGKDTIERITNKISVGLEPKLYPKIEIEEIAQKKIIVIEVNETKEKPVFAFGRAFKRVGKSTLKMGKNEIEKLILERKKIYWDEQICEEASLEDIDWEFVKIFFIPKYESLAKRKIAGNDKEILKALGCIENDKPTNAGILLFGKNPQRLFRNSYIALARYRGKQEGIERLDYREFVDNIFKQIDNCDEYLKEHLAIMSRMLPHRVEREDISEYCWFSIRELITNAICHRDYSDQGSKIIIKVFSDRTEFYNPGGLPVGITPKNITEKQYSRNPVISNVLAKIKYIEELGEGWNKIINEHKKHPLKPKLPKIKADKYSILVTIFSTKEKFKGGGFKLNERQKKAIEYTRKVGKITNAEYQKINKTMKKTATRDLQNLVRREILIKKGRTGKGVYYILSPIYKGDIRGHKGT